MIKFFMNHHLKIKRNSSAFEGCSSDDPYLALWHNHNNSVHNQSLISTNVWDTISAASSAMSMDTCNNTASIYMSVLFLTFSKATDLGT